MSKNENKPAPRGRRVGESGTREAILAAAKKRFASDGFAATTIRKVAADAGVNPALVIQFYQAKDALFAASLEVSAQALHRMDEAFDGPTEDLGARVARAFLGLWGEKSDDSEALLAMLRATVSNEIATARVREFVQFRLVEVISPKLKGQPDAAIRAGFAAAMLVGVIVGRDIVQIPVIADEDFDRVIAVVGPAIQAVLVGEDAVIS